MPIDEISRNSVSKKVRRSGRYSGIIICVSAAILFLGTAFAGPNFATNIIFGVLGGYSFIGFVFLFAFGLLVALRKKVRVSRRYAIFGSLMVFALFTALHIAFTFRQLEGGASFNTYMTSGFEDATRTPGGVIFALPSFALFAMTQSVVASIILLSVLFIVAGSFITAHIVATRGSNSALAIVESQFEVDDKARKKKVSDDYKKTTKELDATLDAKYQEMLQKQSSKRMATAKSELGLTDPPKDFTPPPIQDVPVPLSQLQPTQMSAPEVITQMSTEAAQQFSAGMGQAFGQQPAASFDQVQTFGQQSNPQPTYSPPVTPPASYSSYAEHEVGQERLNRRLDEARKRRGMGSLDDRINSRGQQQMTMEVKPEKVYKQRQYVKPPISLITSLSTNLSDFQQDALEKQRILDTKLNEFGVNAKVTGFTVAPAVTRFEIQLDTGTKVQQVEQLQKDFSMVLGTAQTRLQLVEGKNAIGIEVPNKSVGLVSVKDIIASQEFVQSKSPLTVAIGKNLNDDVVIGDIATMPHLLIAGSTGTGKSVGLNTLLVSLLYRAHPDEVKLLLVDPKQVELNQYNDGPHMLIPSAITSVKQAINAMKWLEHEMRRRYAVLKANGVNNIGLYHSLQGYKGGTLERMPYIVMVIDEVADLIQQGKKEVEASIQSLSSLARACGIHMVLATQRPSTDIITGVIKTNFVVRMAFQVSNRHDSTTIISDIGAEKLVGKGDMLYMKESKIQRVQCAFTDIREASAVMDFIRRNNEADFDYELENVILNGVAESNGGGGGNAANGFGDNDFARGKAGQDPLFVQVLKWLVREENYTKTASISNIQRHFNVGFARAGRIIDQLAEAGYVTSGGGTKARNVLVTRHEVDEAYGE